MKNSVKLVLVAALAAVTLSACDGGTAAPAPGTPGVGDVPAGGPAETPANEKDK